jgi:hypothetical protein
MAFAHGSKCELWLNGADVSPYFRSADVSFDVDSAEATTFRSDWKMYEVGTAGAAVDAEGLYDPAQVPDLEGLLQVTPGSVLTVGPAGLRAGDRARLLSALTSAFAESAAIGDVVSIAWSTIADLPVGLGHVLEPMAEIEADANGTTLVGPLGGTTTGAIAHLHVTAVSADDELDVKLQDSANGTDWADITGGAFATVTAPGAERLVIPGTIRRYVRAVFDVTGDEVAITCGIAFART